MHMPGFKVGGRARKIIGQLKRLSRFRKRASGNDTRGNVPTEGDAQTAGAETTRFQDAAAESSDKTFTSNFFDVADCREKLVQRLKATASKCFRARKTEEGQLAGSEGGQLAAEKSDSSDCCHLGDKTVLDLSPPDEQASPQALQICRETQATPQMNRTASSMSSYTPAVGACWEMIPCKPIPQPSEHNRAERPEPVSDENASRNNRDMFQRAWKRMHWKLLRRLKWYRWYRAMRLMIADTTVLSTQGFRAARRIRIEITPNTTG